MRVGCQGYALEGVERLFQLDDTGFRVTAAQVAFAEAFQGTGFVVRLVCLAGEEQRVMVESQGLYVVAGGGYHGGVVVQRPGFVSASTDAAEQVHGCS